MCDVCPRKNHTPIYTISPLTGERLCLCVHCADHRVEPIFTIVHGVNAGALEALPYWVKQEMTFFHKGAYYRLYDLPKFAPKQLMPPAPPPPPIPREEREARQLVSKMRRVTDHRPDLPTPPKKRLGWVARLLSWRSAKPVVVAA